LIFAFVRSLIGSIGRLIMDFYISNSLIINSVILLYAFVIFLSRRNYFFILNIILREIGIYDEEKKTIKKKQISNSDFMNINWESVKSRVKFPFITLPKQWSLVLLSKKQTIERHYSREKINLLLNEIIAKQE